MLNFKGIAKIFEEIELRLIRSMKRNIGRHKQEEQQENFQWTAWQAEKLRNLDKFRRENSAIMNEYADIIDSETRQLMDEQFKEGVNGVVAPEAEPISETPQAALIPEPKFFGVDNTKVTKLIDDLVNLEKQAETAALRTMNDVYRQTVNKAQLAMSTGSVTLQQAIDIAVKDFLDKGINCIVYRDGRRVNIADYVRMALRTTSTRAKLQGESERFKAMGYDTVQVSKYSMCSDTCLPWQGKAYINDVFVMWDGEVEERENGELWGKSNYCGKWFPLLSTAIHAGLFHPNCRHTILLYRDGDQLPKALDNSEIEKRYKLEQKQRRLENEVRRAQRRAEGFSDPENIKKAKKELREAQKKLREFIDQVNKEYGKIVLKRDYGREKVYDGEVNSPVPSGTPVNAPSDTEGKAVEISVKAPETLQGAYQDEKILDKFMRYEKQPAISENNVDKSAESGIIEETREFEPLPPEKVVPVLRKDSQEWIDGLSSEEVRAVKKYTKNSGDPKDDKFYARLNAMLRGNIPENDTLNYYSDVISGAISKFELQHDIVCYRTLDFDAYKAFSVGDIFIDPQFISTSVVKSRTLNNIFMVKINVPKGSSGAYIEMLSKYPNQREFIIDKQSVCRIVSKSDNFVELEMIL